MPLRRLTKLFLAAVPLATFLVSSATAITIEIPVIEGSDDAEETKSMGYGADNGMVHLTSSDLQFGAEAAGGDLLEVGIRFQAVEVPAGATIEDAFIQFAVAKVDDPAEQPTNIRIHGELSPNPTTFTDARSSITTRPKTSSFTEWNNISPWTIERESAAPQRTPTIRQLVQDLVDQPQWASGNAMSFIFSSISGNERAAVSFNGALKIAPDDPGQLAPRLSISFAPPTPLQAGDADQDLDFDQFDLIQVQQAAKYLTGEPATWGQGDWDGAPGGAPGEPPAGDGLFNQFDIIRAQQGAAYLSGPYASVRAGGREEDRQVSIRYDASTGEIALDVPAGRELTSVNIDSQSSVFTGDPAQNMLGGFDYDGDNNIFKATFGESFGSLSFGAVAQAGLSEQFILDDLTVTGSYREGGTIGRVDLIYIPEPSTMMLMALAIVGLVAVSSFAPRTSGSMRIRCVRSRSERRLYERGLIDWDGPSDAETANRVATVRPVAISIRRPYETGLIRERPTAHRATRIDRS